MYLVNCHRNSGAYYGSLERQGTFFYHELGHLPQWASGRLTTASYLLAAGAAGYYYLNGLVSSIHDAIPYEAQADAFAERLQNAYNKAGKPCG